MSRTGELRVIDPKTGKVLTSNNINYGSTIYVKEGQEVKRGDKISDWDPFNAVIVSDYTGIVHFDSIEEGVTYRLERDDQTGFSEKVIIESKNKRKIPIINMMSKDGELLKSYTLPVGAYISIGHSSKKRVTADHRFNFKHAIIINKTIRA